MSPAVGRRLERRLDGEQVERVVFALVAQRACEPGCFPGDTAAPRSSAPSKTTWAGGGCAGWCGWPTAGSPPPPTAPT